MGHNKLFSWWWPINPCFGDGWWSVFIQNGLSKWVWSSTLIWGWTAAATVFESNMRAIKKNYLLINKPQRSHPSLQSYDGWTWTSLIKGWIMEWIQFITILSLLLNSVGPMFLYLGCTAFLHLSIINQGKISPSRRSYVVYLGHTSGPTILRFM